MTHVKEKLMDTRTLVGILGSLLIAAGFVFGLIVTHNVNTGSTPLITTVLGFVSLILLSLVKGAKSEQQFNTVKDQIAEVDTKAERLLNGEMEDKIRGVLTDLLTERLDEPPPTEDEPRRKLP